MSHLSKLIPDDRDWVDELIDAAVNGNASVNAVAVTGAVMKQVRRAANGKDKRARRALAALAVDGAYARVRVRIKERDRSRVKLKRSGSVVNVPSRVGHRARAEDGRADRYHQQTLWFEMPWDQFEWWLADRARHRDHLSAVIEAYREVLPLRAKHPDTATPLEACEREGIDPRSLGLDRAA